MVYCGSLVLQVFTIWDYWLASMPYLDLCLYLSLSLAASFEQTTWRNLSSHVSPIPSRVRLFFLTFLHVKDQKVAWLSSLEISHQVQQLGHAIFLLNPCIQVSSFHLYPRQCDGQVFLIFYISRSFDVVFVPNFVFLVVLRSYQVF